jgi:hypothetical protein
VQPGALNNDIALHTGRKPVTACGPLYTLHPTPYIHGMRASLHPTPYALHTRHAGLPTRPHLLVHLQWGKGAGLPTPYNCTVYTGRAGRTRRAYC